MSTPPFHRQSLHSVATIAMVGALTLAVTAGAQNRRAASVAPAPRVTANADGSVVIGNPAARVRLTEYVSYTCGHCATYAQASDTLLRSTYIAPGNVAVEVRNLVRDPLDMTAAMLAHCGSLSGFPRRHAALMASQRAFFDAIGAVPQTTAVAMGNGSTAAQRRLIASSAGMTAVMTRLGVTPAQQNVCLADATRATKLEALRTAAFAAGVTGTPSFQLNGALLSNVHNWPALQPRLDGALAAQN